MMHYACISPALRQLIESISMQDDFKAFRLGGGTALALQCGHRISVDADFISEKDFDREKIIQSVAAVFSDVRDVHQEEHGVFMTVNNMKLDFLTWRIPFIRAEIMSDQMRLLHIEEIAAMKLFAILQRGEKKDYIDIAVLLREYSLSKLLSFYKERHPAYDEAMVLRYLLSHADFENQPMPNMLMDLTWEMCKKIIQSQIAKLLQQ